jgi:hypothetical protein
MIKWRNPGDRNAPKRDSNATDQTTTVPSDLREYQNSQVKGLIAQP